MKPRPARTRPDEECSRCRRIRPAVVISQFKPICVECWNELNNPAKPVNFSEVAEYGTIGARERARTIDE